MDLLIGSLAMHGNKVDKVTGDFVETIEEKSLRDRNSKKNEQIDPRIYIVADYIILHPSEKVHATKRWQKWQILVNRDSAAYLRLIWERHQWNM